MSDTTPELDAPDDVEQIDPTDLDAQEDDDADTDTEQEGTGRAAKLRQRAQQAEADRDAATALVDALRRAEVARLVAEKLAEPADLWEYGDLTPGDLVDDTGLVDPGTVSDAVDTLIEARPGLAKAELRKPIPGTYQNAGQFRPTRLPARSKRSWSEIL